MCRRERKRGEKGGDWGVVDKAKLMDAAPLELGIPRHSGAYGHVDAAYIWISQEPDELFGYELHFLIFNLQYYSVKLGGY